MVICFKSVFSGIWSSPTFTIIYVHDGTIWLLLDDYRNKYQGMETDKKHIDISGADVGIYLWN